LDEAAQERAREDSRTVTGVLLDVADPGRRRRALWLPASLWRGRRTVEPPRSRGPRARTPERSEGVDRVSV
jgi:hypothetical protein